MIAGTQIRYIPTGEHGIIVGGRGSSVFCLFFHADGTLRTTANAESVRKDDIVKEEFMSNIEVKRILDNRKFKKGQRINYG